MADDTDSSKESDVPTDPSTPESKWEDPRKPSRGYRKLLVWSRTTRFALIAAVGLVTVSIVRFVIYLIEVIERILK